MTTTITNVRVFNGEHVIDNTNVVLDGAFISTIGSTVPAGSTLIDGRGATLLPGLIDAHTHTSQEELRNALVFGITTELEMMGHWTANDRLRVTESDDMADVRSAGFGITPPGGHPSELLPDHDGPPPGLIDQHADQGDEHTAHEFTFPEVASPDEAITLVEQLVATGSDYIKIMIEEGSVLGRPGLPLLTMETIRATVDAAHRHGKLAIAHVLTAEATRQAIDVGVDGLAHLFLDQPHTLELVAAIAASGAFVTPCLTLNASIMGHTGAAFAADPRVRARLSPAWLATIESSFNTYPQGNFADVLATVAALHRAGVDILVGTDVSVPLPQLGGLAHGASVHHELQLLVTAGFTPIEALQAATSVPARRFNLLDRGRIEPGLRADLLLVDGDPTTTISDTLSIRDVWRRGVGAAKH